MPEPRSAFCSPLGLLYFSGGEAIDEEDRFADLLDLGTNRLRQNGST